MDEEETNNQHQLNEISDFQGISKLKLQQQQN